MKRGLNFHLPVSIDIDLQDVDKIEFIFSKFIGAEILKKEIYPNGNVKLQELDRTFLIPFSSEETYNFQGQFYMDTRITLKSTTDQPQTEIITLNMDNTLFPKFKAVV